MDLRDTIAATLSADGNIRQQAELSLKAGEAQPGLPHALLDILQSEQDAAVRLSAAIYLKNRVSRGWAPQDENPMHRSIPEEERKSIRDRLLQTLASSTPPIRAQLFPMLQTILQYDYGTKWPEYLPMTLHLINTADASSVSAGLQCLLAVCRCYRFKAGESREDLDKIVTSAFNTVYTLGLKLLNETSQEAGEMLHMIMKCYKHAIYYELPMPLRTHQATVDWCTLFLTVIAKQPPPVAMVEDIDEREQNKWWKARKWAYANLNRLFRSIWQSQFKHVQGL